MRLEIRRTIFTEKTNSGILRINGQWFCFTLEDVARPWGVKIPGKTCIPDGDYKVVLDFSPRFKKVMPHILDVPLFTGVRIHCGNFEEDTDGCILVGCDRTPDHVWRSRDAFNALMTQLEITNRNHNPISLSIVNAPA